MATIIAGVFSTKALADDAVGALELEGIGRENLHCISLNSPGQHDVESHTMAKSDEPSEHSPGEERPRHAAKGGASDAAIGAAVKESGPTMQAMRNQQEVSANTGEGKKQEPIRNRQQKIGRNDPCPCGSGKKYKNCCMRKVG